MTDKDEVVYERLGHIQKQLEEVPEIRAAIVDLKIELAAFKAKWGVLVAIGSAALSVIASLVVSFLTGGK